MSTLTTRPDHDGQAERVDRHDAAGQACRPSWVVPPAVEKAVAAPGCSGR
jgi:hypothetical protein